MSEKMELVARPVIRVETGVTLYDRVSGSLTASVVVSGMLMGILLTVWFCQVAGVRTTPDSLVFFTTEAATEMEVAGDVDEPQMDELLEVQSPELTDAVKEIDVVTTVQAISGNARIGRETGDGDSLIQEIPPHDKLPAQRWQITFAVDTIDGYAELLDRLGVELAGVERAGDEVVYVKDFTGELNIRVGQKRSERRIYFSHSLEQLRRWDLDLLRQANVERVDERLPLHFYPVDAINRMYLLENRRLHQDGKMSQFAKTTTFRVVPTSAGYDIELDGIEYVK